jgi:DNA-binding response OmpR family regulator
MSIPLEGRKILIVEDDYMVAQLLTDMLEEAGAQVVGPFGWLEEALRVANDEAATFDSAILDVDLHGKQSYPVADALAARNVKVIFCTGYDGGGVAEDYRSYPHCTKPFGMQALLAELLPGQGARG